MADVSTNRRARLRGLFIKAAYRLYLWSFRGTQDVFQVSERIVEYPFVVNAVRELSAGSQILLVGCHGDLLSTILPCLGLRVVGIDVKDFPLEFENFRFRRADIRHTEFEDETFDAAVAVSTVEHIGLFDDDPEGDRKAIREMLRVIRPGGPLILTVPFASSFIEIPLRERIYDDAALRKLMQGFQIRSLTTYAYSAARLWTRVMPSEVPEPSRYTTHCTALVVAAKPTTA